VVHAEDVMVFAELSSRWSWRPIAGCPGRFVFASGPTRVPLEEIAGETAATSEHRVAAARDPVIVLPFDDGGLISYVRADGTFVHTLNTLEGFTRKLAQLGIVTSLSRDNRIP
jgi:hypothetical protein